MKIGLPCPKGFQSIRVDAVPEYPKPPTTRTVLERVYKFPQNEQDAVFASAPTPRVLRVPMPRIARFG
jgi:hypothetical protein